MIVKVTVPAVEKMYGVYNPTTNSFENVQRVQSLDSSFEPDNLEPGHELLNVKKIKLLANIPSEELIKYLKEN